MVNMPIISGTHYCTKCNHEMYWEHFIPYALHSAETFVYTPNSHSVQLLNDPLSKNLEFSIECTKCNQKDCFSYNIRNLHNKKI